MSNKTHEFTTIIGPSVQSGKDRRKKPIPAADGWPGLVILLSYYTGGTNLFPPDINPEFYLLKNYVAGQPVHIAPSGLTQLGEDFCVAIDAEFKPLMPSSLKEYLLALKKGRRANGSAQFPKIDVKFYRYEDPPRIEIPPSNWAADKAEGMDVLILPEILGGRG